MPGLASAREFLLARRYDLVASWIVLGVLVAAAVAGFGLAMLIGQRFRPARA